MFISQLVRIRSWISKSDIFESVVVIYFSSNFLFHRRIENFSIHFLVSCLLKKLNNIWNGVEWKTPHWNNFILLSCGLKKKYHSFIFLSEINKSLFISLYFNEFISSIFQFMKQYSLLSSSETKKIISCVSSLYFQLKFQILDKWLSFFSK